MRHADFKTLMNRGGGGASANDGSLITLDFKNGVYTMGGVTKPLSDIVIDAVDYPPWAASGFVPQAIVPEYGWVAEAELATDMTSGFIFTPEAQAILDPFGDGFSYEAVVTLGAETTGTMVGFGCSVTDDNNGWETSYNYSLDGPSSAYSYAGDWFTEAEYGSTTGGTHRLITSTSPFETALSDNGGPILAPDTDMGPMDEEAAIIWMCVSVNNSPTATAGGGWVILEKIVFVPRIAAADLPSYPIPAPQVIGVIDFKNNTYSLDGVTKTLAELFYDYSTVEGAHVAYKPVVITPGVGMVGASADAPNKNFSLYTQPELHEFFMSRTTTGFSVVMDYSLESENPYGAIKAFAPTLMSPDTLPNYSAWVAAAALGTADDLSTDYFSCYSDYYSYEWASELLTEGSHRSAVTYHDDVLAASTDGGAYISDTPRGLDPIGSASMVAIMARPDPINFGPMEAVIEKITLYSRIPVSDLPSYSV